MHMRKHWYACVHACLCKMPSHAGYPESTVHPSLIFLLNVVSDILSAHGTPFSSEQLPCYVITCLHATRHPRISLGMARLECHSLLCTLGVWHLLGSQNGLLAESIG